MSTRKASTAKRRVKRTLEGPVVTKVLEQMYRSSDTELSGLDMGIVNLKCALGLPYAENVSIARCLERLDRMARRVRLEPNRNLYRFHREPERWGKGEAYWRACMMITVLQQDFGVRYNPRRIHDPDFRDSRDLFIHGILFGDGGTCASMPVLYVAVGRRLRYPLKLVHAKGHVFARWDDPDGKKWGGPARLNIEASGRGMSVFPDEHYQSWPHKIQDWELAEGCYLRSLTPREEFASFLTMRGHCLQDTKRFAEAAQVLRWAAELDPKDPLYGRFRNLAMALAGVPVPRGFERFAEEAEQELARINALDS